MRESTMKSNTSTQFNSYHLLILASCFFVFCDSASATKIGDLEEITMQVIEPDSIENIEIQQLIQLPVPTSASNHIARENSTTITSKTQTRSNTSIKSNQQPNNNASK